jgi:ABC-type branched-subunit amino acid transport system ATPase component
VLIDRIASHIVDLNRAGITFLLVEHNLDVVEQVCDHVVVMAVGRTLATGRMDELRQNEEVIRAYLGGRLMSVLRASGVTAGYGKVPVIQDVSIGADPGAVVAIVGPNGAGKSTFLKAIIRLLPHAEGKVEVAGKDVSSWPAFRVARAGMAYVPRSITSSLE